MKKRMYLLALFLAISQLLQAENFIVFGDSLSDTGNLAKFTYNSGKLYDEHLATYFGENFPAPNGGLSTLFGGVTGTPPSLIGPNWAQGGAVANTDLGMGLSGITATIKFQTEKQINKFLEKGIPQEELKTYRAVYWIGGNDMRLVFEGNKYKENTIIDKSIEDVGKQTEKLVQAGIKFLIIPKVPDISYTPKFLKQFGKSAKIDGKTLYKEESGWIWKTGLSEDDYEKILDTMPSMEGQSHEDRMKEAIKLLLEKQNYSSSPEEVEKWLQKYKEEKEALSKLVNHFNEGVDKNLEELQEKHPDLGILRPDIANMITEAVEHPEYYGFTSAIGTASKRFSSVMENLWGLGAGTGRDRIAAFDPEDHESGKGGVDKTHLWNQKRHYLFADEFHPSPEAHKIMADYMISLLETEDGDTYDDTIPFPTTIIKEQEAIFNLNEENKILTETKTEEIERGYVHFGAIRTRKGGKLNLTGLKLKNRGIALSAEGKNSSIHLSDYSIQNIGMLSSAIQVEEGANIILENGSLSTERGSKISYPFGARVNGKDSSLLLKHSKFDIKGKQSVGVSIGNQGKVELESSHILTEDGNGLHIANGSADLKDSTVKSEKGTAVWLFSNDNIKTPSILSIEGGEIQGKEFAVKITPNMTKFASHAKIFTQGTKLHGGIFTHEKSQSDFTMKDTEWKMGRDSSVTNLNMENSHIYFSTEDSTGFNTLTVKKDYIGEQSFFHMRGQLSGDDSPTDLLVIQGKATGRNMIDYQNLGGLGAATNYGIKIIDLTSIPEENVFQLVEPVYAGNYEYALLLGGKNAESEDFYLTSTLINQGGNVIIPLPDPSNPIQDSAEKLHLLRPKVSFLSMFSYANMENSIQNIFHLKDRNTIFFTTEKESRKLLENKSEIKINSSISRLSYPLSSTFGIFFSIGEHKSKFYDMIRIHFKKDTKIGDLHRKDYNIGLYYQHKLLQRLHLEHTFQYQRIENKYTTENISKKEHGYALAFSSLLWYPISFTESFSLEPHYQLDMLHQELKGSHDYAIRSYIGGDILWKINSIQLGMGIDYSWNLRKVSDTHDYHSKSLTYNTKIEYKVFDPLHLYGKIKWKKDKTDTSYELGIKYRF